MPTVSATEVARNFGKYAQIAQRETVTVTTYDRPQVVILSPHEYERLRRLDRVVRHSSELPPDVREAIAAAKPSEAAAQFNHELE